MARKRRSRASSFLSPQRQSETELLGKWRNISEHAIRLREKWREEYDVDALNEAYTGSHYDYNLTEDRRINRFWPAIKSALPSLFFESPSFKVRPLQRNATPQNELQATIGQGLLESIALQENNLRNAARLAIQQSLFSIGVMKVIYDPRTRPNPQSGQPIFVKDEEGRMSLDPTTGQPIPVQDEEGQQVKEPRRIITDEIYRWEWVNASNMILPDQGPDRSRWTWIGEEVIVPVEVAKGDQRFTKAVRDLIKSNVSTNEDTGDIVTTLRSELNLDDFGKFKYTEIWDIYNRKLYAFCDGVEGLSDKLILNMNYPDGIEEHPYSILSYTPILEPDPSPWPVPHTYNWLPIDSEYNVRRTQMFEGLARTTRKVLYQENTFPDEQSAIDMLSSPQDMEAVRVVDITRPPIIHSDTPISASFTQDLAFLDREFNRTSGSVGARTGNRAGSATEANIENQAGNIRDTDQRNEVSTWLADSGAKMFQLVKKTLTLDVWIKIRGFTDAEFRSFISQQFGDEMLEELSRLPGLREAFERRLGEERWETVTREELEFEADVSIIPGSVRPKTLEAEREDILQFMAILGANPQLAQSRELMLLVSRTFEFINEALVDELFALSQRLIEQQANQAGRNQGGNNPQSQSQGGLAAALLGG